MNGGDSAEEMTDRSCISAGGRFRQILLLCFWQSDNPFETIYISLVSMVLLIYVRYSHGIVPKLVVCQIFESKTWPRYAIKMGLEIVTRIEG